MQAKHSLLIVDDHTILRQGIRAILQAQTRYNVVGEARDGLEAIQRVGDLKPSLVLTDLIMPRMNGIEAIREIKAVAPATKIVVLTAQNTEEYIFASLKAGADSYVLKDADSSELLPSRAPTCRSTPTATACPTPGSPATAWIPRRRPPTARPTATPSMNPT